MNDTSNITQIFLDVTLNDDTLKSLRMLQSPSELHGKVVLMYAERIDSKPGNLICILNGSRIGPAITSHISASQLENLSTIDEPFPTKEHPIKYCLYIDNQYTLESGVWELFMGDIIDPSNQHQSYYTNYQLLMDTYKKTDCTNLPSAYILRHYFKPGTNVSDTTCTVLHGL